VRKSDNKERKKERKTDRQKERKKERKKERNIIQSSKSLHDPCRIGLAKRD
jgi:hypothetical protein